MSESMLWLLRDTRRAKKAGPDALAQRQRSRIAEQVAFARAHSPYYRELYRTLPQRIEDATLLPVTDKKRLMARFDEWVTDRDVTIEKVRAFSENPGLVGERFLGRYTVLTTSGTTGTHGIFVLDDRSLDVASALTLRMMGAWLGGRDVVRIIAGGLRLAMVIATGGHFASIVAATRLRRRHAKKVRVFSVNTPLPQMVAQLNEFAPAILAPYASVGALLASEQEGGRLRINPVLVVLSAEGLPAREYDRIARAFRAKVRDGYAATECPFLSYRCEHGWLHVNIDWAVLEPVDDDYRPVPAGEQSRTVLVSNLANRVQPILRYDLGDSVLQRPDPCPCGDPLPAIRVQGRAADALTFETDRGERVSIAPLVVGTVADRIPELELFQIVQTTPMNLRVRLRVATGADPGVVWQMVYAAISGVLAEHQLGGFTLERAEEPPEQSPGGKYRTVIPWDDRKAGHTPAGPSPHAGRSA